MSVVIRSFMVLVLCWAFGCQTVEKPTKKSHYLRFVGDIESDKLLDDPNFVTCSDEGPVMQYFNTGEGFGYEGEKPALLEAIKANYEFLGNPESHSGYIRIRFIVNCNGDAGRFRVLTSDEDFKPIKFDTSVTDQFVHIISELDGWQKMIKNETALDYYTYIIVKLENGIIKEILP